MKKNNFSNLSKALAANPPKKKRGKKGAKGKPPARPAY